MMEEKKIWQILNTLPTKDEKEIKAAYRKELLHTNPEDMPLEFKELRTAYELALKMIKIEENDIVDDDAKKDPVNLWMGEVKTLYENYHDRINVQCWEELLKDDVCIELDYSNDACEKLLMFLTSFYNLPCEIYKEINNVFGIIDSKKEWYEKFPKEFIDFVEERATSENNFAYDLFDDLMIEDCSIYDDYMDQYYRVANISGELKNLSKIENELEKLKKIDIYHPYTDTESIFFYISQKKLDNAIELSKKLMENDIYMQDKKIQYVIATVKMENKEYEEAYKYFEVIIKSDQNYIGAELKVIPCLLNQGKYEEAKTKSVNFLDKYGNADIVIGYLQEANQKLMEEYKRKSDDGDIASLLELGWCYFQNERFQECIKLLDAYEPDKENEFEYYNLKGRCLLANEQYESARSYLVKWRELFDALVDDGSEKYEKRIKRKGYSRYVLAMCYSKLALALKNDNDKEAVNYNKEAMLQLKDAIKLEKDERALIHYKERLSNVYLHLSENEKCISLSDEIIDEFDEYYPAYINRQEAYYNLKDAQKVVDDYYKIIKYAPNYAKAYIYAISVFLAFGQYDEAKDVLDIAEKNVTGSDELKLVKSRVMYCLKNDKDSIKQYIKDLLVLRKDVENNQDDTDIVDRSAIDIRLCVLYMDMSDIGSALNHVDMAISIKDDDLKYYWIKADILYECDMYKEAFDLYEKIKPFFKEQVEFLIKFAKCQAIFDAKKAISLLKEAIEIEPKHEYINNIIMKYYKYLYMKYYDMDDYVNAKKYAKSQLEINDSACYYISRGILYLEGGEIKEALEDFKIAAIKEPSDIEIYNYMGCAYKRLGMFEEAIKNFELVLDKEYDFGKKENGKILYDNLYTSYFAIGRYDDAKKCLNTAIKLFPEDDDFVESLCDLYEHIGNNGERIKIFEQIISTTKNSEKVVNCLLEIAHSNARMDRHYDSLELYKKAIALSGCENKLLYKVYSAMGTYYEKYKVRLKKSLKYYKMAFEQASEDECIDACLDYARLNGMLKDYRVAIKYYEKAKKTYASLYGSLDNYLKFAPYSLARYYSIGKAAYYSGKIEEAKKYLDTMKGLPQCESCTYRACYEAVIGQAMLCEADKDYEKALDLYIEACDINSSSKLCQNKIIELKKMTKRG